MSVFHCRNKHLMMGSGARCWCEAPVWYMDGYADDGSFVESKPKKEGQNESVPSVQDSRV